MHQGLHRVQAVPYRRRDLTEAGGRKRVLRRAEGQPDQRARRAERAVQRGAGGAVRRRRRGQPRPARAGARGRPQCPGARRRRQPGCHHELPAVDVRPLTRRFPTLECYEFGRSHRAERLATADAGARRGGAGTGGADRRDLLRHPVVGRGR